MYGHRGSETLETVAQSLRCGLKSRYSSEAILVELGPRAAGLLQGTNTLPHLLMAEGSANESVQNLSLIRGYHSSKKSHGPDGHDCALDLRQIDILQASALD